MKPRTTSSVLLAALFLAGCSSGSPVPADRFGPTQEAEKAENGLTYNSLAYNSLAYNSLLLGALATQSLASNSLLSAALTDPASVMTLRYLTSCALPADAEVDVNIGDFTLSFFGGLGLAPQWADGPCDASCMAWVSACVIARINAVGNAVPLSIRGVGIPTSSDEISGYPTIDGVYFGNIFSSPMVLDACLPTGVSQLTRTCGTNDPCGVNIVGSCDANCTAPVAPPAGDGSYSNCQDGQGTTYPGSISVFLLPGQVVP